MSGAFHLVHPNWTGEIDDEERVVDSLYHAPTYLEECIELWRIAGKEDHAHRIREVTWPGYERADHTLHKAEIETLLRIIDLDGLEAALQQTGLVDAHMMIYADRLSEVRRRADRVQVGERRGNAALYGVSEAVSRVDQLCAFLQRALDEGLHVALD